MLINNKSYIITSFQRYILKLLLYKVVYNYKYEYCFTKYNTKLFGYR